MHLLAKEYSQRPSSFLGLPPASWSAYQFDLVVRSMGVQWENEQYEAMKEDRPQGGKGMPFSTKDNKSLTKPNASWGSLKGNPKVTFT